MSFIPYAVSWNVTSRCNLNCQHCYLDANGRKIGEADELSTEEALDVLTQIAELNPSAVLIFTGGEPLLRPDINELIKAASEKGMMAVLGTNGVLLNNEIASTLKDSGLSGVGVSIDSLSQDSHDSFRGCSGALQKSMDGLVAARDAGLAIQVQTTPTSANIGEIPSIAEWAHQLGSKVFNLFFLVCTGRGQTMTNITPDDYEKVLKWASDNKDSYPGMMIRPKCAPHFKRILHEENPDNHLLKTYIAACRAGTHYMRIDPTGRVTACPYMDTQVGDLRLEKLANIWNESPDFKRLRTVEYDGKCGLCRYRMLCGGCRARALATLGNDMGEDQWCVYEPVGQEEALANDEKENFDLANLVDNYVKLRNTNKENLFTFAKPDRQYNISGTAFRIEQLLDKLLDNAVDFSPNGNKVEIKLAYSENKAKLTVTNQGKLLPAEIKDQIFDYMVSVRKPSTDFHHDKKQHLGLGLAISKKIVLHHGGSIEADNLEDKSGVMISIMLPLEN